MKRLTLAELARRLGGEVVGDGTVTVTGVRPLDTAGSEHLSFLANPRYRGALSTTRAGGILVPRDVSVPGRNLIRLNDPYLAFARVMEIFHREENVPGGVSPLAFVHAGASLGKDVSLHPFAVVSEGAVLGDRVTLMPGAYVGPGATVGDDTVLHPHVVLEWGVFIGERVIIHAGTVVGSDGFGFAPEGEGYHKIPHAGTVRVENDVEIGSNCSVDRAVLGETVIGAGTKMDNLIQVGHNVVVGKNCILVGQTGIAGSTVLGDHVTVAGQSGVSGHLKVGAGAVIAAKTAVFKDVPAGARVAGIPATDMAEWRRNSTLVSKLDGMRKRISRLEAEISILQGEGKGKGKEED